MSAIRFAICLSFALFCFDAFATDVGFGSNALPFLATNATLIVETGDASPGPFQNERLQTFRVHVAEVFAGNAAGTELLVLNPRTSGSLESVALQHAILFLAGPLDGSQKGEWEIQSDESVFQLVAGSGAAVQKTALREEAVRRYLSAGDSAGIDRGYSWASDYVLSEDPFLQRSAIHQLYRLQDQSRVLNLLDRAVRSPRVELENRRLAVQAIASFGTPTALAVLKSVAEDKTFREKVRVAIVEAIDDLPGGEKQLQEWTLSKDGAIASAAKATIRRAVAQQEH